MGNAFGFSSTTSGLLLIVQKAIYLNCRSFSKAARKAGWQSRRAVATQVDFGAHDPQGPIPVTIFMSHAAPEIQFVKEG